MKMQHTKCLLVLSGLSAVAAQRAQLATAVRRRMAPACVVLRQLQTAAKKKKKKSEK